jgi:hypothetical protein
VQHDVDARQRRVEATTVDQVADHPRSAVPRSSAHLRRRTGSSATAGQHPHVVTGRKQLLHGRPTEHTGAPGDQDPAHRVLTGSLAIRPVTLPPRSVQVFRMVDREDLEVQTLGPCRIDSPLAPRLMGRETTEHSLVEEDRVFFDDSVTMAVARGVPIDELPTLEPGGPRKKIYFDPSKTRVGIVTCGGLCPGLNDVIRGLVLDLFRHYGVRRVVGFRNGYRGFVAEYGEEVVDLTPEVVRNIDDEGGTMLGTSRGGQDPEDVVDALERMNLNILFVVGGDGSIRGAMDIVRVVGERGLKVAVVVMP